MIARDRDAAGRARNARPRDGLGRPLPRGAIGEPTMPDDLRVSPDEGVRLAQELLDQGRPFHAHEVLEALWKSSDSPDSRELWQGAAQLAVGVTHYARGNIKGAEAVIRRGRDRLARLMPRRARIGGVDVAGVVRWADEWLAGRRDRPLRLAGPEAPAP